MARWFGYRPGYDDLCRVWLPEDVADQFRYVAGIVDELRAQLRAMKKQGLTPQDFGLMVRMHPETLKITAQNKLGAAEAKAWTVDIAAKRIETTAIDAPPKSITKNRRGCQSPCSRYRGGIPGSLVDSHRAAMAPHVRGRQEVRGRISRELLPFVTDALFADSVLSSYVDKTTTRHSRSGRWRSYRGRARKVAGSENLEVAAPERSVKTGSSSNYAGWDTLLFRSRFQGVAAGWLARMMSGAHLGCLLAPTGGAKGLRSDDWAWTSPDDLPAGAEDGTEPDAAELWSQAKSKGAECLVGVKIAIPGKKPGEKGAEVKYMLNSVALDAWRLAVVEETDPEDLSDLDGADDE